MNLPSSQLQTTELSRFPATAVIIPALNEEAAIGQVLAAIPTWVRQTIVVDNGSTDQTADIARAHGARVVVEKRRGYGSACLAGLAAIGDEEVVVFLDGDFSDRPDQMQRLIEPIVQDRADLVIGSRTKGRCEAGALTLVQRLGNTVACGVMQLLWGVRFTDLGPFRAVRRSALERLHMADHGYGWTVQMQVRAARLGLRVTEVPVSYRRRIGRSKISGTIRGVLGAGSKILYTILKESLRPVRKTKHEWLIVFARYPQPGMVKTRLIPTLGAEGAATLQHRMTLGLLQHARRLRAHRGTHIVVRFAGGDPPLMRTLYGNDLSHLRQCDGDLGARLSAAFAEAFSSGAKSVIAVGSDCPALSDRILADAFDSLSGNDVVLGPANDGGYYLIGSRRLHKSLFQNVPWGTDRVHEQTLRAATEQRLAVRLLITLGDVDLPEDLIACRKPAYAAKPEISVIIPALNENEHIGHAIRSAMSGSDGDVEVVVVDADSSDGTANIAKSCGAEVVLCCSRGRGRQMNLGAAAARGHVLLFLHADSTLPFDYMRRIRQTLSSPGTVAGAFSLEIEPTNPVLGIHAAATNFRSRALGLPYGDQAIFLTRSTFDAIGGYQETPILEDVQLILRLRRRGCVRIANGSVRTSARRWQRHGVWQMSLLNQLVILGSLVGAPAKDLRRWRESGIILSRRALLGCKVAHAAHAAGPEAYEAVGPPQSAL